MLVRHNRDVDLRTKIIYIMVTLAFTSIAITQHDHYDHVHLLEDASQAASLSGGAPAAHGADRALVVPGQHQGED